MWIWPHLIYILFLSKNDLFRPLGYARQLQSLLPLKNIIFIHDNLLLIGQSEWYQFHTTTSFDMFLYSDFYQLSIFTKWVTMWTVNINSIFCMCNMKLAWQLYHGTWNWFKACPEIYRSFDLYNSFFEESIWQLPPTSCY